MQRPCRVPGSGRLCGINVKLTTGFAVRPSAARVGVRFPRFLQGSCGTRCTGDVKQIGRRSRRGGVGIPAQREADKATSDKAGCSQHPAFAFF